MNSRMIGYMIGKMMGVEALVLASCTDLFDIPGR